MRSPLSAEANTVANTTGRMVGRDGQFNILDTPFNRPIIGLTYVDLYVVNVRFKVCVILTHLLRTSRGGSRRKRRDQKKRREILGKYPRGGSRGNRPISLQCPYNDVVWTLTHNQLRDIPFGESRSPMVSIFERRDPQRDDTSLAYIYGWQISPRLRLFFPPFFRRFLSAQIVPSNVENPPAQSGGRGATIRECAI